MKIHFSVDDVFGVFRWMTINQGQVKSIFETDFFGYLKTLHEKYNIEISLYCMYSDGKWSLEDISDRWKKEFEANTWLKFGFHCYGPASNYTDYRIEDFSNEYARTIKQLKRIVGASSFTDTLRLHFFSGNEAIGGFLYEKGIKELLYADDDRISYGVDANIHKGVNEKGYYVASNKMAYRKTNIRLEKDVENEIYDEILVVFTHEICLRKPEIKDKLEALLGKYL